MTYVFKTRADLAEEMSFADLDGSLLYLKTALDAVLNGSAAVIRDFPVVAGGRAITVQLEDDRVFGPIYLPTAPVQLKGAWATGLGYQPGDWVTANGGSYICTVAHVAGASVALDAAAGKWMQVSTGGQSGFVDRGVWNLDTAYDAFDAVQVSEDNGVLRTYIAQAAVAAGVMPPEAPWGLSIGEVEASIMVRLAEVEALIEQIGATAAAANAKATTALERTGILQANDVAQGQRLDSIDAAITQLQEAVGEGISSDNITVPIASLGVEGSLTLYVSETEDRLVEIEESLTGAGSTLPEGGTTGQVLAKASGNDGDVEWVTPASGGGGGGATTLDELTDVQAASPTTGQVLAYDGAIWKPTTISTGGGGGGPIDASEVTFGSDYVEGALLDLQFDVAFLDGSISQLDTRITAYDNNDTMAKVADQGAYIDGIVSALATGSFSSIEALIQEVVSLRADVVALQGN